MLFGINNLIIVTNIQEIFAIIYLNERTIYFRKQFDF